MEEHKKEKKKLKKWEKIKKILLIFFLFFMFLFGILFSVFYFYKDTVKTIIVNQINKQLSTEIQVNNITLSFFQRFPNISLTLSEVIAKDAITSTNKGNLLKAENVYLQFSILDLLTRKYEIKKIEAKNGLINLVIYNDGSDNYHFWKSDTATSNESIAFNLKKVILTNIAIQYVNYSSTQHYSGIAKKVELKGQFKSTNYDLSVNGHFFINFLNISGITYFPASESIVDMILYVDQKTNTYVFKKGEINFGNLQFETTGNVIYSDNIQTLNLTIKGSDLQLQSFISQIPTNYRSYFEEYKAEGEIYFTALINGSYRGSDLPIVKIDFGINDAKITHYKTKIALTGVSFLGTYTNGIAKNLKSSVLKINNFKSGLKSGRIWGSFSMSNFVQPEVELKLNSKIKIDDLMEFIKLDTLDYAHGSMEMNVVYKGKIKDGNKLSVNDFIESKTAGSVIIKEVDFAFKKDVRKYKNINADLEFNNNDLIINKITGNMAASDFTFSGNIKNLLSYLFIKNQKLQINGKLSALNIKLDELMQSNITSIDSSYNTNIPEDLEIKMGIEINKFSFNKFMASNITGNVVLKNKQILISPLSFQSMDGTIDGLVIIDGNKESKLLISCEAKIKQVDIKKLFYQFDNFGQNSMKDENIKGKVTSTVQFAGVWNNNLEPDLDKIYAVADIKIENGQLLNYSPLLGLSKFMKVSDLNDVKFATLHNQIEIKNNTVYIPAMEVKSSAIDIIASGEHTFENKIDYRIKLLLSDVLAQKAKKAKKENEEFGIIEDDGLGRTSLYILVTGTVDNPVYKYDAKGVKAKIAVGFAKEKQNIKTILNEEFGLFKKDSTVIKNKKKTIIKDKEKENLKKQEEGEFIIDWDEKNE